MIQKAERAEAKGDQRDCLEQLEAGDHYETGVARGPEVFPDVRHCVDREEISGPLRALPACVNRSNLRRCRHGSFRYRAPTPPISISRYCSGIARSDTATASS